MKMYLITNDSINPYCAICKDAETIMEYLRALSSVSLEAVNYEHGTKQKFIWENGTGWDEVMAHPENWKFLVCTEKRGKEAYCVHAVDYIE